MADAQGICGIANNKAAVIDAEEDEEGKKEKASKRGGDEQMQPYYEVPENYKFPPLDLLEEEKGVPNAGDIKMYSAAIKRTLQNFSIEVDMAEVNIGPAVTQYTFKPAEGVKVARITTLRNDLSLALAAHPIRIEAPIPGRALIGVELPNKTRATVRLRSLLDTEEFKDSNAPLLIGLGKDVSGKPLYADLARMPHMLVAGATGSGKTIGLNNLILSLIYRNSPETLRLILVDPKRVEFPVYNELPHLLACIAYTADVARTSGERKNPDMFSRPFEDKYPELVAEYRQTVLDANDGELPNWRRELFFESPDNMGEDKTKLIIQPDTQELIKL